ncbi:MAG: hypothetical protein ACTSWL_01955, partial [Promethearchaeota archaeon]
MKSESLTLKLENLTELSVTLHYSEEFHSFKQILLKPVIPILFLNSSFFNQKQWKKSIRFLDKKLKSLKFQFPLYITYDYSGIGKSTYIHHSISINDYLFEI